MSSMPDSLWDLNTIVEKARGLGRNHGQITNECVNHINIRGQKIKGPFLRSFLVLLIFWAGHLPLHAC